MGEGRNHVQTPFGLSALRQIVGAGVLVVLALAAALVWAIAPGSDSLPAAAQAPLTVVIDADPATPQIDTAVTHAVGESFDVGVVVQQFQGGDRGMGGASFTLHYDPAILEATGTQESAALSAAGMPCPISDIATAGKVLYACVYLPFPADGPQDNTIPVGSMHFRARASGTVQLSLVRVGVALGTGDCAFDAPRCELPADQLGNATVTITGQDAASPVATEGTPGAGATVTPGGTPGVSSPEPSRTEGAAAGGATPGASSDAVRTVTAGDTRAAGTPAPSTGGPSPSTGSTSTTQFLMRLDAGSRVSVGQTFHALFSATGVPAPHGLGGFSFDLRFDPSVLELDGIQRADDLNNMPCPINQQPNLGSGSQQTPGLARLVCVFLPLKDGPVGDLELAQVTFKAKGNGDAAFVLERVNLGGGDQQCLFATRGGCLRSPYDSVTIPKLRVGASGGTRWGLIAVIGGIAAAVVIGAGGVVWWRRRRRAV